MKILFICTSNKDRSPSLEKYFSAVYPQHEYRSAGINKYFCGEKKTHYLTQEDIDWADLIVCAEQIHCDKMMELTKIKIIPRYSKEQLEKMPFFIGSYRHSVECGVEKNLIYEQKIIILSCGNYQKGALHDDYLTCAEQKLEHLLKQK